MGKSARQPDEREFAFSEKEFRFLVKLVSTSTGIVLAEHKKDMVYSRLARRLRALGMKAFSEYCDYLDSEEGAEEMGNLVNAITTNLTSFFRETHHFDHLRDNVVLPLELNPPEQKRLRIWSAGCSSGMEPYSIAMTVKHALGNNIINWDVRILATDIDTNMLKNGEVGEYNASELTHIPNAYHKEIHKIAGKERIGMSDALKKLIAFKALNLLEPWPMSGPFDAVFCRNVVIYFDKPTQQKLFNRIADLLTPRGWLYIGHSENLFKVCDRFELVGRTIYRRIK
jgi:chemotaxis protein methyltransferase CheR